MFERSQGKADAALESADACAERPRRWTVSAPTQLEFQPAQYLKVLGLDTNVSKNVPMDHATPSSTGPVSSHVPAATPASPQSWVHRNYGPLPSLSHPQPEPMFAPIGTKSPSSRASREHELPGPEFWAERARRRKKAATQTARAAAVPYLPPDERTTESFDMRAFLGHAGAMPAIGQGVDESSFRRRTQSFEAIPEPTKAAAPAQIERRIEERTLQDDDEGSLIRAPSWNEADRQLFPTHAPSSHRDHTTLLVVACLVTIAVAMIGGWTIFGPILRGIITGD